MMLTASLTSRGVRLLIRSTLSFSRSPALHHSWSWKGSKEYQKEDREGLGGMNRLQRVSKWRQRRSWGGGGGGMMGLWHMLHTRTSCWSRSWQLYCVNFSFCMESGTQPRSFQNYEKSPVWIHVSPEVEVTKIMLKDFCQLASQKRGSFSDLWYHRIGTAYWFFPTAERGEGENVVSYFYPFVYLFILLT